jgi:hypothetical protein
MHFNVEVYSFVLVMKLGKLAIKVFRDGFSRCS